MDLDKFEEQVFFSTVRITILQKSGKGASIRARWGILAT